MNNISSRYSVLLIAVVIIIASCFDSFAQGSPPLLLDDTGTPGPGRWEINLVTSVEHSALGDEWQVPLVDINYGLGDRIQLKVESPFVIEKEEDGNTKKGFDGMEFGIKYRFIGSDDTGISVSCYPQVYLPFESSDGVELVLPIQWHQEWTSFGLTAEIGHAWVQGKPEGWEGGVGVALFFEPIELLLEWHTGIREASLDLNEPMMNVGLVWEWRESCSVMFSIGKSLHNRDEETNLWGLGGIQFLL